MGRVTQRVGQAERARPPPPDRANSVEIELAFAWSFQLKPPFAVPKRQRERELAGIIGKLEQLDPGSECYSVFIRNMPSDCG